MDLMKIAVGFLVGGIVSGSIVFLTMRYVLKEFFDDLEEKLEAKYPGKGNADKGLL